jgi:hypothetical protein
VATSCRAVGATQPASRLCETWPGNVEADPCRCSHGIALDLPDIDFAEERYAIGAADDGGCQAR